MRRDEQLTKQDLSELERIFLEEAVATEADLEKVRADSGLGVFIRSLVGLERDAAKRALGSFVEARKLNANQIEFIDMIVDYLMERGVMDARRLYESPFTDLDDQGVSGVFPDAEVQTIVSLIQAVQARAAA